MESGPWNQPAEAANGPTTYNLLFVCSGNTCRSPLAAAITERLVRERGWQHVSVGSAGTAALNGALSTEHALAVASENGLDLMRHRSRELTTDVLEWADLVLTMTPSQLDTVVRLGGSSKVALVTDFIEGAGAGEPVHDPFGGDLQMYRRTFAQLEEAATALLTRLEPILAP
jgi:protein-tyrosine-phosphatase